VGGVIAGAPAGGEDDGGLRNDPGQDLGDLEPIAAGKLDVVSVAICTFGTR